MSAVLKIQVLQKRMLDKREAAHHCGRSLKTFLAECPARPIRFANGDLRYDVKDLDSWIDSLKAGAGELDADDIVARLGT